jgi:hypothetical protein
MFEFKREKYGADVATILETEDQIVEVLRHPYGTFQLIVHNRRRDNPDLWDDLSATLTPQHFIELGKVADHAICHERECPYFGKSPSRSCKCHPRYGSAA